MAAAPWQPRCQPGWRMRSWDRFGQGRGGQGAVPPAHSAHTLTRQQRLDLAHLVGLWPGAGSRGSSILLHPGQPGAAGGFPRHPAGGREAGREEKGEENTAALGSALSGQWDTGGTQVGHRWDTGSRTPPGLCLAQGLATMMSQSAPASPPPSTLPPPPQDPSFSLGRRDWLPLPPPPAMGLGFVCTGGVPPCHGDPSVPRPLAPGTWCHPHVWPGRAREQPPPLRHPEALPSPTGGPGQGPRGSPRSKVGGHMGMPDALPCAYPP